MQGAVDPMSKACDNFQLTNSTKKTEVVHQPAPVKPYCEPTITVNRQQQKLLIISPILEALCQEQCTLIIRLQPELRMPAKHLADFAQMSVNEMKSGLILS